MFNDDFMMRIFEQWAKAILKIVGWLKEEEPEKAMRETDDALDRLGIPKEFALVVDLHTLIRSLQSDSCKMHFAADLLQMEAILYTQRGDIPVGRQFLNRSIELRRAAQQIGDRPEDLPPLPQLPLTDATCYPQHGCQQGTMNYAVFFGLAARNETPSVC